MEQNRKNKKKIVLIVLIVALAALAVGIAIRFMHSSETGDHTDTTTAAENVETAEPEKAVSEAETQTAAKDAWIKLYKDYLTGRVKTAKEEAEDPAELENNSPAHFSLIYLDDDAIPELVVSEDFYHAASATLAVIYDGKVQTFKNIGSYGGFQYKERQGIVVSGYDGSGTSSRTVYHLEQGELNEVWSGSESQYLENEKEYYFGDYEHMKEVTEEEYRKAYDTYIPVGMTGTLRDDATSPAMTAKNVEAYFKALENRESVPRIRAYSELTFAGTVSEAQTDYYDDSEYYEMVLDEPVVVQFEEDEFPAVICAVRLPEDERVKPGAHLRVKSAPCKERDFIALYYID